MTVTIDRHSFTATLPDDSTVAIVGGELTLDELWSPYAQATVTIPARDDLTGLDPRDAARVALGILREFAVTAPVSALSAAYGASHVSNLTTWYGAGHVSDLSALYTRAWVPGETRRDQTRTADLGLRRRTDNGDGTLTLALASDEALLLDYAPGGGDEGTTHLYADPLNSAGSLISLVRWVIFRVIPDAEMAAMVTDYDISSSFIDTPSAVGYEWIVGRTAIDFLTPFLQVGGLRLWCDETRLWHLETAPVSVTGTVAIAEASNLVAYTDQISRDPDSNWYNAVVIVYRWTEPDTGQQLIAADCAPDVALWPAQPRVLTVEHADVAFPSAGGAAKMLARVSARGHDIPVRAVSDYTTTPGMAATVAVPEGGPYDATVASVTWEIDTAEMSVAFRDTE